MHVGLGHVGNVHVYHVGKVVDVDSARSNVGGNKHAGLALLKACERCLAGILRLVSVDCKRRNSAALQIVRDAVGSVLGAGKHQNGLYFFAVLKQVGKQVALGVGVHKKCLLHDGLGSTRNGIYRNANRINQKIVAQAKHFKGHGGAKKHGLALARQLGNHLAHVVDEAHVEHAVGLVEHKPREVAQVHVTLLH